MALTKVTNSMIDGAPINVKDFGAVGNGVADDTAAIQAAINYASNNNARLVYAPQGQYLISTIYLTYDASLNPNFNSSYMGRIEFYGDGNIPEVDAIAYPSARWNGTVLKSNATTTSAVVMSTAAQGTSLSTYPVRGTTIRNCTVYANTTAYAIENNGCPEMAVLLDVTAIQNNAAGGGVLWKSSWYSKMENVLVTASSGVASTGYGITIASTSFAGLYSFDNCYFKRFGSGVAITTPLNSAEFTFNSCSFEANQNYGILVQNSCKNLNLHDCYWEFNGINHVRVDLPLTNFVTGLQITGGFMYGSDVVGSAPSGPFIYLKSAQTASIDSMQFMRPWTTLIYNYWDSGAQAGKSTTVKNCSVDFSGVSYGATTINCIDSNAQSGIPLLIANEFPTNAVFTPVNPSFYKPNQIDNVALGMLNPRLTEVFTYSTTEPSQTDNISLGQPAYRIYTVTNTGFGIEPPSGASGQIYFIGNSASSTQTVSLFKVGAGALTTLAPGEGALWISNPLTNEFVAWKTTFVN
jgi:hypothetical protein